MAAVADDGAIVRVGATAGIPSRFLRAFRQTPLTAALPWCEALRSGAPLLAGSSAGAAARARPLAQALGRPVEAFAALPLHLDDRSLGVLVLLFGRRRDFGRPDAHLLGALAHCACAVERKALLTDVGRLSVDREQLAEVLDLADDAVVAMQSDLTVSYLNSAARALFGTLLHIGGRVPENWHGVALRGILGEVAAGESDARDRLLVYAHGARREVTARRGCAAAPLVLHVRETAPDEPRDAIPGAAVQLRSAQDGGDAALARDDGQLRVGVIAIDLPGSQVTVEDRAVSLTLSEFRLLALLAKFAGRVVSRKDIVRHLWQSGHLGNGRMCDGHVANLRRKIEREPAHPERLVTVRGKGYKLVPG